MNFFKSYLDAAAKRESAEAGKVAADAAKLNAIARMAASEAKKTAAEVAKLVADKDAATAKAAAETANIVAETWCKKVRRLAVPVVGATVAVALFADYVYHENESFIKWRMKRHLCAGVPWPHNTPSPAFVFQRAKDDCPPQLFFQPLLLLGPTGCGKSTLLYQMAQQYKAVCPTVLIRICQDAAKPKESTAADTDPVAAATRMNATSKSICDQLAYPFRRCLLVQGFYTIRSLSIAFVKLEREHMLPSAVRLEEAFSALFDCCNELHEERLAQGIADPDAACVIIIEGVPGPHQGRAAGAGRRQERIHGPGHQGCERLRGRQGRPGSVFRQLSDRSSRV